MCSLLDVVGIIKLGKSDYGYRIKVSIFPKFCGGKSSYVLSRHAEP